jgi:hypothetical protein
MTYLFKISSVLFPPLGVLLSMINMLLKKNELAESLLSLSFIGAIVYLFFIL